MVRSLWQGALVVMLASAGLAWSQQPNTSANKQATMTVHENGKEVRCRVISRWRTSSGARAFQLQVVGTGEMLTVLEKPAAAVASSKPGAMAMKIYHWGQSHTSPPGAPLPPAPQAAKTDSTPHAPAPLAAAPAASDIEMPVIPPPPDVEAAKRRVAPAALAEQPPILINVGGEHTPTPKLEQGAPLQKSMRATDLTPAGVRRTLTVYENGKELHCEVLTSWKTPAGARVFQLQAEGNGEKLTLVEDGPATSYQGQSGKMRALSMKVYHWGNSGISPVGAPVPPGAGREGLTEESEAGASTRPVILSESQPRLIMVRDIGAATPGASSESGNCSTCANANDSESSSPTRRLLRRLNPFGRGSTTACVPCQPSSPYAPNGAGVRMVPESTAGAETVKIQEQIIEQAPQVGTSSPQVTVPMQPSAVAPGGVAPPPPLPSAPGSTPPASPPAIASESSSPPIMPTAWPPATSQATPAFPTASTGPAAPTAAAPQTNTPPATAQDWRHEWGQSAYNSKTKQPGQTLVDPTPIGKGPALPKQESGPLAPAFAKNTGPSTNDALGAIAHNLPPVPAAPPASATEASKQPDPLLNPDSYQPAAVQKRIGTPGQVYVPRPGTSPTAPPPGGPLPLGTVSVLAAQNGMVKPVQFVPVPVATVPQPWRAPAPPPPTLPQAPQLAGYVNAFSQPRPETPPPEPQPPGGAFTTAPNSGSAGPVTYGQMPYGPPSYGQMPYGPYRPTGPGYDPRMMAAYNPQQAMYGPPMNASYMPPSMTNSMPAYAYQQMAQGMPPQRPIAQVNFPAGYQGPMPPNPVAAQPWAPYPQAAQPYANPAMDRPGMPMVPNTGAPGNVVQTSFSSSKTVLALRDSIYPAEREVAALNLAGQDLRMQPGAVQVLISAARQDPAGSVRAACIRCLARQVLGSEQVMNLLNDLRNDQDPRVRQEVEIALAQVRR